MKNIILLFVILLAITSCNKEDFTINNLNGNKIAVLGHGGMGLAGNYPLNSFESIMNALYLNSDGTEIDVQMTKDSVLVAFHDEYLEQSTNATGRVYTKTWDEIKSVKYINKPYTNYKLISLDELFSNPSDKLGKIIFLDCKSINPDESTEYNNTFIDALLSLIDKYDLEENVYIEFKREDLIKTLKTKRQEIKQFAASDFESSIYFANKYNLEGIMVSVENITKDKVEELHSNGIMVAANNTASKSKNIEAIDKNVDFIQTNKLKHLIKMLK